MNRTTIINSLIKKIQGKKYLEIGISNGENFKKIICDYKIGVDPEPLSPATLHVTSDQFFESNKETFDVIFIDGLHHADQVEKDILNSIACLSPHGYIICHDMNPLEKSHQVIPFTGGIWNGNCWEALVNLRRTRTDLDIQVVNVDHGCGVIKKSNLQELLVTDLPITYENFDKNRKEWLNLISEAEFQKYLGDESLQDLLNTYILEPENSENNFALACYYNNIGQSAAAVSYYIRTAERTVDDVLKYECLIQAAMCFDRQGTRSVSVKGMLQHAVALLPKRPEAYFLLSRYYEKEAKDGDWFLCYMMASIGLNVCEFDTIPLRTSNEYPGKYGLIFEKAVSSWWCGLCSESAELFQDLYANYKLDDIHKAAVLNNLQHLQISTKSLTLFDSSKHDNLRVKFNNSDKIKQNYSEAYQDMFVLTLFNGKQNGTYLEIGAGNAYYGNNTALLEKDFAWTGVSLDVDTAFVDAFAKERKNPCVLKDATLVDYDKFLTGLGFSKNIDYLQLDCDPPDVTYKILASLPLEKYKFGVITYEHDYYCDATKSYREKSRMYLESFGYVRVVSNIAPDAWREYEDWWVHPELVDPDILQKMINTSEATKSAESYMLGYK